MIGTSSFDVNLFFEGKNQPQSVLYSPALQGRRRWTIKWKAAWRSDPKWLPMTFTSYLHTSASIQSPWWAWPRGWCGNEGVELPGLGHSRHGSYCFAFFLSFSTYPSLQSLHPSLTWLWGATMSRQHPRWPTNSEASLPTALWLSHLDGSSLLSVEPLADIVPATSRQTDPELEALR